MSLIILMLSSVLFAHTDLSIELQARSYPDLGAALQIDTGYNFLLYGQGKSSGPVYGLIRPSLTVNTSGVVNMAQASLELYPISFLGFEAGVQYQKSNFREFSFYDCEQISCDNHVRRTFFRKRAAIGFGRFIALADLRYSKNHYRTDKIVGEFRFFSHAQPHYDENYFARYVLGFRSKNSIIGLLSEYNKFTKSRQRYWMHLITYIRRFDKHVVTLGIGSSKSDLVESGFSTVLTWKFNIADTERLF